MKGVVYVQLDPIVVYINILVLLLRLRRNVIVP